MKRTFTVSLFAIAVLAFTACAPPASTNTNSNTNANTNAAPKAAAPSADELLAMENKAWEAWKNKDTKYFEGLMADNFVGFEMGKRRTRAEMIKMISEHPCDIKSFSVSQPRVTSVSNDVVVVTYKGSTDGTCAGEKAPANVTAASVYVRSGNTWKAAYHGEVPIVDAPTAAATGADKKAEASDKPSAPAASANTATATSNSAVNTSTTPDALTEALTAMEKKGWEAWMKQDAATLQTTTTKDLTFVDSMGKATHGQAEVMKVWITGACKVSSVNVSDGKATQIADNVAIFTYKGTAEGTCGDTKLTPLWAVTVAVKEGDAWKAAYIFEMPT